MYCSIVYKKVFNCRWKLAQLSQFLMLEGKLFNRVDIAVPVRGTVNETVDSDRSEHIGLYMDISILVHGGG